MFSIKINITNFTHSWSDGLAMCALLHRHRADLIDFSGLSAPHVSPIERLTTVFSVAKQIFRIPILVNPVDFIACCNDERCVVAVVATWYHRLNAYRVCKKSASRLSVALTRAVMSGRRMIAYVKDVYALRQWIKLNLRYIEDLSGLKDGTVISKKLEAWRENEKYEWAGELEKLEVRSSVTGINKCQI